MNDPPLLIIPHPQASSLSSIIPSRRVSSDSSPREQGRTLPPRTCGVELRAALEEFFDRFSLSMDAHQQQQQQQGNHNDNEDTFVPFDVQFQSLVTQYTDTAIAQALQMTCSNDDPASPSYTGRLPIHLACDKAAPVAIIQWLVQHSKPSIRTPDKWGDLPIHTACSRKNFTPVIRLLLQADPSTVYTRDLNGLLPLHMACRYNLTAVDMELLLQHDTHKTTLLAPCAFLNNQVALHIAARCDAPASVLHVLLQHDDSYTAVLQPDATGRLPLHVAYLRNAPTDVIQLLLQYTMGGRMERHGVAQWKSTMHQILQQINENTYERDFMTREKLNVLTAAIQELMEYVVLLELAAWRNACLATLYDSNNRNDDTDGPRPLLAFKQPLDQVLLDATTTTTTTTTSESPHGVSLQELKQQARIKSGAEEIVRHVLPFLEGLPLDRYLQEFPSSPNIATTTTTTTVTTNNAGRIVFPRTIPAPATVRS